MAGRRVTFTVCSVFTQQTACLAVGKRQVIKKQSQGNMDAVRLTPQEAKSPQCSQQLYTFGLLSPPLDHLVPKVKVGRRNSEVNLQTKANSGQERLRAAYRTTIALNCRGGLRGNAVALGSLTPGMFICSSGFSTGSGLSRATSDFVACFQQYGFA